MRLTVGPRWSFVPADLYAQLPTPLRSTSRADNPGKDALNLTAERISIGVVFYDIIGAIFLKVQRQLSGFSPSYLLFAPTSLPRQPRGAEIETTLDEHHAVTLEVEIRLEQQRTVQHQRFDTLSLSQLRPQLAPATVDPRVDNRLQATQPGRACKNRLCKFLSADRAVRMEDLPTPPPLYGRLDGFGLERLPGQSIRIEAGGSQVCKELRDQAFTGAHTTNQTDNWLVGRDAANPGMFR